MQLTLFQARRFAREIALPCTVIVMLHCDNSSETQVKEIQMELVILSALAAVVILVAEIRDLAARQHPAVPSTAGTASLVVVADRNVSLTTRDSSSEELDRAA